MARLTNLPVQQYRGTAAKTDAYTGPEGELTVTTDVHGLRIHDGALKGGHAVAMAAQKISAGDGIAITGGTLGVDNTIAVKPATEDALGGLIVGKNLDVNADGAVSTKDWTAAVDELNADTGAALAPLLYDTALVNVPGETATVLGRSVGELVWALLPVRAAGFQLLDGSLIYSTGIYAAFYNYMVQLKNTGEHNNLFITETAWQQSVTTYGVCGKFVLDTTAGTVRIPKVTLVEGTIDAGAVGELVEAGYLSASGTTMVRYNKGFLYIIVGTYAKSDLQVNIDNVATDVRQAITVAQEAALSTATWPDYSSGIAVATPYTAVEDGYVYLESNINESGTMAQIDGVQIYRGGGTNWNQTSAFVPISKGSVLITTNVSTIRFFPILGV